MNLRKNAYIAILFLSMGIFWCQDSMANDEVNEKESPVRKQVLSESDSMLEQIIPDSVKVQELDLLLQESKLKEMNLQLELEQIKLTSIHADSVRQARQKVFIDSLRTITSGIPLVIGKDTLFSIFGNRGGLTAVDRVKRTSSIILELGKRFDVKPDSVYIYSDEFVTDIMYKEQQIISLTDNDALWENTTRQQLAEHHRKTVVHALQKLHEEYNIGILIKRILLFILVVTIQGTVIWFTNYLYRKLKGRILELKERKLKPVFIGDYEFLNIKRLTKVFLTLGNITRYLLIFFELLISVPILFSIFPQTKDMAMKIISYIVSPVKKIGEAIIDYIPNLFTILIIWLVIRYVIKGIGYMSKEIESERLKIRGFYADWAKPTYNIVRFLLYAFMIAMIYPYFPGSKSQVFQGVSVFVGLIISFGSSSAIGNIIAGMIITYMRPFKIGDRIKLNDTMGNVIEKTPFVTRLRTLKNEVVTIPNSSIMSSQTTNLSASARTYGLIIHTEITCGYTMSWRKIHELLIEAAMTTEGVMKTPEPFVVDQSLNDFYVVYQINAYIKDADKLVGISTLLHQNILDIFEKAGVEIVSPHYYIQREE